MIHLSPSSHRKPGYTSGRRVRWLLQSSSNWRCWQGLNVGSRWSDGGKAVAYTVWPDQFDQFRWEVSKSALKGNNNGVWRTNLSHQFHHKNKGFQTFHILIGANHIFIYCLNHQPIYYWSIHLLKGWLCPHVSLWEWQRSGWPLLERKGKCCYGGNSFEMSVQRGP